MELAPRGITVNAIARGATDTPLNEQVYTPEVRRTYEERIPLGHTATAEEVAGAAVFLASDAARYVTGQELGGRRRADGQRLRGRGRPTTGRSRGSRPTARPETLTREVPCFTNGLAVTADGGLLVSCYRPDRIYDLDAAGNAEVVAEDPQGTLLAAPPTCASSARSWTAWSAPTSAAGTSRCSIWG